MDAYGCSASRYLECAYVGVAGFPNGVLYRRDCPAGLRYYYYLKKIIRSKIDQAKHFFLYKQSRYNPACGYCDYVNIFVIINTVFEFGLIF